MLTRRIIPCLDVKNGRNVRGVRFSADRDAGDPVELAAYYNQSGADELVFYDITASAEHRDIMRGLLEQVADQVFIPLTVGGGIRNTDDMFQMLRAGADKVSLNTATVDNPDIIREGADRFGSQCIVHSIDAQRVPNDPGRWEVWTHGGRVNTGLDAVAWAVRGVELGAGEIVMNSIDADGTRDGYDLDLLRAVSRAVPVPVVASGGAGTLEHLAEALSAGEAHAVLAASIFHYKDFTVDDAKEYLAEKGIPVRKDF
jgi:imidazole glycerol-phosphate synthase subunit HisF